MLSADRLFAWRQKAQDRLKEMGGMPTRKHEAFRYFLPVLYPEPVLQRPEQPVSFSLFSECPYRVVFIDGFYSQEHSLLPKEILCLSIPEAMQSYGVFLQHRMQKLGKEEIDPFALWNGAFQGEGVLLYVHPECTIDEKIQIHCYSVSNQMAMPRIHLYVGRNSRLELIQTSNETVYCNAYFDATLDENSFCRFVQRQAGCEKSLFFQSVRATLKKESRFESLAFMQGAKASRSSYRVQLAEEKSEALLQGLSRLDGERQNHVHVLVEHAAIETRSRQHFKGILFDKALSSFEGKILVKAIAQKTEAYQLNANLPLGEETQVYSKPNLEIFADDVKASHGATIAQIAEEDLFYLRSRGLSREEAHRFLIRGFCRDLIDAAPFAGITQGFVDELA
ncbi:MAG: SufD family Fe-S cluster assembly protein [Chlamydiia bacterium]|nr:SufD family Fe-S cluster assembly protein [Chlamydiia bacterium]